MSQVTYRGGVKDVKVFYRESGPPDAPKPLLPHRLSPRWTHVPGPDPPKLADRYRGHRT